MNLMQIRKVLLCLDPLPFPPLRCTDIRAHGAISICSLAVDSVANGQYSPRPALDLPQVLADLGGVHAR